MEEINTQKHWETIYATKSPNEVSWTQEKPTTSLKMIADLQLPKTAKIIDVGAGESRLVDDLLKAGYENITVLDISATALEKVKIRLGDLASKVTFIVADITQFKPAEVYDLWHDRAVFHFLTTPSAIQAYTSLAAKAVSNTLIMGTFSTHGPLKCSGLTISQYDAESLSQVFEHDFKLVNHFTEDHSTPFNTQQNFLFCTLKSIK